MDEKQPVYDLPTINIICKSGVSTSSVGQIKKLYGLQVDARGVVVRSYLLWPQAAVYRKECGDAKTMQDAQKDLSDFHESVPSASLWQYLPCPYGLALSSRQTSFWSW